MNKKLFFEAIIKFVLGVLIVGLLIFIPEGTINYFNGWLFMAILFIPMFIAGIIMIIKAPDLLRSRLNAKEKEKEQKLVVKLSGLMFLIGFIIAGLNYRYNFIQLPNIVVIIGMVVFLFLSMPLILSSLVSFIIFLIYPFIIAKRIKNEEEYLEKNLKGYKEYKKKVKYKLIPFIW